MLMTKQQFQDSIRARKPMNVWFLGEKIEDVTTYPPLAASFNAISKIYELQHRPELAGSDYCSVPYARRTGQYLQRSPPFGRRREPQDQSCQSAG